MAANPISILFVVPALGGGGAEMHVARLAAHLDPSRFTSTIVCLRPGGEYETGMPRHVTIRYACRTTIRSSTLSAYLSIPGLVAILRQAKPGIVCSFLPHTTAALYIALRASRVDSTLMVGVQNNPAHQPWSHAALTWPLQVAYRRALRVASTVVALSDGVAKAFAASHPDTADKICRIYNIGADAAVLTSARAPMNETLPAGPLVVACGRLTAQKDYPTLLRAFRTIVTAEPAHLWILGRGPLKTSLETMAQDLGIADRVRFLGFRSNPFAYMARADCFVLSSAWEGFANVIVEAMACGSPVVSTRCPFGPDEIISDGVDGLLTEVGDADELGQAIGRVLIDRGLAATLAAAASTRARDFMPETTVTLYQRVFEQAARGTTKVPRVDQPALGAMASRG